MRNSILTNYLNKIISYLQFNYFFVLKHKDIDKVMPIFTTSRLANYSHVKLNLYEQFI